MEEHDDKLSTINQNTSLAVILFESELNTWVQSAPRKRHVEIVSM